jgi:hypothetical protein
MFDVIFGRGAPKPDSGSVNAKGLPKPKDDAINPVKKVEKAYGSRQSRLDAAEAAAVGKPPKP